MSQVSTERSGTELKPTEERTWVAELWDWAQSILIAFVIVILIHQFVFNLSTVEGHSMQPTLQDNERLFVNKAAFWVGTPKFGDIVILKDPRAEAEGGIYLVKRVIGQPGDTIEIRNYQLYRNGVLLTEPYLQAPMTMEAFGPQIIPDEHYFVMGDNRNSSTDSRKFGSVHKDLIKGRAEWILWPPAEWGGVE